MGTRSTEKVTKYSVMDTNDQTIHAAHAAVRFAQEVRAAHRKRSKRGNRQRETDIRVALVRLKRTMAPIRSELTRSSGPSESRAALVDASQAIQRERRKLWKMQARKEDRGRKRRR